jgi:Tol biopolymer transport system component
LTNNPAYDGNPFWSPDGKHIAFESDRSGLPQVYVMDTNGSNITQITDNEAAHSLPYNIDGRTNPWSPDSRQLWISSFTDVWNLYKINIDDSGLTSLIAFTLSSAMMPEPHWSPDGEKIAFFSNDTDNPGVPRIYVVDANGENWMDVAKMLPQGEQIAGRDFYWSRDGQSIIFITHQKGPYRQTTVYEFNLESNALVQKTSLNSLMLDWHDGISLILPSEKPETTFIWQRPDGTGNTLDWGAACWELNFSRSPKGNFAIAGYCPDHKSGLYWANSDGSIIKKLLVAEDMTNGPLLTSWSPDDQYIAFNIFSSGKTDMYIVNVNDAKQDPSAQPFRMTVGNNSLYYSPVWQPVPAEDIVNEKPSQTLDANDLIVFTSNNHAASRMNEDIYTMQIDGGNLTNLTSNIAQDYNPVNIEDLVHKCFTSDTFTLAPGFTLLCLR